jgi:hypothetical protein
MLKTFNQFNEEIKWNPFRKLLPSDLYTKYVRSIKKVNKPSSDKYFYGLEVQDLYLVKDIDLNDHRIKRGIFLKRKNFGIISPYQFCPPSGDDIWFDDSAAFINLHSKSKDIGFIIGSDVTVSDSNEVYKIISIDNFAFYTISSGIFEDGINKLYTLLYTLDNGRKYQPSQLSLSKSTKKIGIVSDYIEDFFLDLIDDKKITYSVSKLKKFTKGEAYQATINCVEMTPESIDDVTNRLLRLKQKMTELNITTTINSINSNSSNLIETKGALTIIFTTIQN